MHSCSVQVFGGSDLLSRVLRHSTIGAGVFNGRVRDGIGFWAHRSNHQTGAGHSEVFGKHYVGLVFRWPFRP